MFWVKISMFEKETSENLVRARRREAQCGFSLLSAAKRGQSHWNKFSEKAKNSRTAVEIFFKQMPFVLLRAPTVKEKTKYFLGECKL